MSPDMIHGAVLVMVLAGVEPSVEEELRARPRLHGEVSAAAGAALAFPALGFGAGLHLELGAVLGDRFILSARASIATIVVSGFFQFGVSGAFAVSDSSHFGIGAVWSANAAFVPDQPGAASVQFPLRFAYLASERAPSSIARTGFQVGFEVAPGIAYFIAGGRGFGQVPTPGFAVSALLTLGYAAW